MASWALANEKEEKVNGMIILFTVKEIWSDSVFVPKKGERSRSDSESKGIFNLEQS